MVHLPTGLLALLISSTLGAVYSPGSPGAPWSTETQKIVKAKLYRIFSPHQSLSIYKDLHPEAEEVTDNSIKIDGVKQKWESMPNSAKVLRLGFHGCFPKLDADGNVEAACNGCLNTEGMNVRFDHHEKHGPCQSDTTAVSHHNGLGPTIEILEKIYRDPSFPPRTPEMETSLFDQGISRADLWAFATISAVEYGIDMHNIMCEDPTHLSALDTHNYPYDSGTSSSHFHYNIHYGETECKIPKQSYKFTTGRSDCTPPAAGSGLPAYHTDSQEKAPEAQGNGAATVGYFKDNFGLNGQETVALMGSHTLGMFNYQHSVMHYTWTSRGLELFNNDYFKILSKNDGYIYNGYDANKYGIPIKAVGDAYGNPAKTRWRARTRGDNLKCGPAFWRHDYLTCQDCHVPEGLKPHLMNDADRSCCDNAPMLGNGTQAYCIPPAMGSNCESYKFSKDPEVAINAEIGLVIDFEVDDNGYPYGCPGFEDFNYENIVMTGHPTGVIKADPICPKQMLAEPSTAKPVSDFVQDYADDRDLWLLDYSTVLAKMLSNGYDQQALTENTQVSFTCDTPKVLPLFSKVDSRTLDNRCPQWQCYEEGEQEQISGKGFFQISQPKPVEDRLIAVGLDGALQIEFVKSACSARQLWRLVGDQIVNGMTGQPLLVGGVSSWELLPNSSNQDQVYIKAAGTKSNKDYLRVKKGSQFLLSKKYGWVLTKI